MRRFFQFNLVWLVFGLILFFPVRAWAHGPGDGGVPKDDFQGLFNITLWIAIPIFLLVEGLLLYAIFRYRRRSASEMPNQIEGNRNLELFWTVASFLIIAVLFVLTVRSFQEDYEVEADEDVTPDLMVHVTGYMFNWDYEYFLGEGEETGMMTTKEVKIPAGRNVLLEITSSDVQHSFWVPDLAGKVDAIPGYVNSMWLKVDEPGTYIGQCAEYCGLNHYEMLIEVDVMEPEAFDQWLAEGMAAATEFEPIGTDMESDLPGGDAGRGAQLFTDLACNSCHFPEEDQPSGPAVRRMHEDAETREGYTAEAYLRESILLPCDYLAEGWDQCIMPQDYGERLDAQGLADLIEYLMTYDSGYEAGK